MRFPLWIFIIIYCNAVSAQNTFKAAVSDKNSNEPLAGVNILLTNTDYGTATDENGYAEIKNIPEGNYIIKFSFIGYRNEILNLVFPLIDDTIFEVKMEPVAEELEEISVSSARGSRLISREPTRIEVIAAEEVDEKITMDPSSISMLLNESTGIYVQQTSAASANNSFRIQGLEGRYTQLLKNGFPLYSGYSGSLSIVQVPPLDLKQVEIIKGSSSTLYGGGAIAGLINLITKEPDPDGELSFLLNGTTAGGMDLSGYYSKKFENTGITFLASGSRQSVYDNNGDNFSDLPEIERYTISPDIHFYIDDENIIEAGGTYIAESRIGGALPEIEGKNDSLFTYTEKNVSRRMSVQSRYDYLIGNNSKLTVKNSIGYFKRDLRLPFYSFSAEQLSTFSEASFSTTEEGYEWILGLNLITEKFDDLSNVINKRDYSDLSAGLFTQLTADLSEIHSAEAGLRLDYADNYDFFLLPRISFLSKWDENITTRVGGGLGYKLPNIFTEATEESAFRNLLPLAAGNVNAEKSYGINFDINYNTVMFEKISISLNTLFFYTRINDPLILLRDSQNAAFRTFSGYYDTKGLEINLKITYDDIKLFTGYTFTEVSSHNSETREIPLTPAHKLGMVLIWEKHENFRIGFEAYYTGTQKLSDGTGTNGYWITGLMIEKHLSNFKLFLNFENFLDTRQSKYGPMFTGSPPDPDFAEIYAPTDGRIINGGIKVKL